jgi:hypothetical protein
MPNGCFGCFDRLPGHRNAPSPTANTPTYARTKRCAVDSSLDEPLSPGLLTDSTLVLAGVLLIQRETPNGRPTAPPAEE